MQIVNPPHGFDKISSFQVTFERLYSPALFSIFITSISIFFPSGIIQAFCNLLPYVKPNFSYIRIALVLKGNTERLLKSSFKLLFLILSLAYFFNHDLPRFFNEFVDILI